MIKVVQELGFEPQINKVDLDSIQLLEAESQRARSLGFFAKADNLNSKITQKRNEVYENEKFAELGELRGEEYFTIKLPEWDGYKKVDEVDVPYLRTGSVKKDFANNLDFQALFMVNINNFVGDIPECVYDAVEQYQEKFKNFAIMFVARISKISELVKNFVKQDPILVGLTNDNYGVVLKMWGNDLEEIDLALLEKNNQTELL